MARWYGPEDVWPRHPEAWWRDALPRAQQAGWYLEHYVGTSKHRWGKLKCTRSEDRSLQPCAIRVDSSGKGAENVAGDVPKKIRNCTHRPDDPTTPEACMSRAAERMTDARGLLAAVDGVIEQQGALARANDLLLDAFDEAAEDVERLVEQAAQAEAEAAEFLAAARTGLAALVTAIQTRWAACGPRTSGWTKPRPSSAASQ